jgi:hypothetical protein
MFGTSGDHAEEEGTDPLIDRPSSAARLKASRWTARLDAAAVEPVRIVPVEQARERWRQLAASHPGATLYHSAAWAEVLGRAYGFSILLAMVERGGKIAAGCLLSPSKIPFAGRFIGLPFSDSAAPLGADSGATRALLDGLAGAARTHANFEIRGIAAPAPWQTSDCFRQWSVDIARPFSAIERGADRNFRRQVRRAMAQAIGVESGDGEALLRRFYRLQLETRRRLGVPPQPWRFFTLVHEVFAKARALEVWIASREGRDLAGVVVLRDGDKLYAKWSARASHSVDGASHLVFFAILEHYAGKAALLDLGRTDARNAGLMRFKEEMGATVSVLPYSYFPRMPRRASAEAPDRAAGTLARVWRHLPLPFTRAIGATAYGFLA